MNSEKKPEKKGYKFQEDPAEDINDRHVANASGATFYDADPLTEKDLAELEALKKIFHIEEK
jgi:hypothetical protein